MRPIKVNGGIFIDWNCSSVQKISSGWFIPDMGGNDKIDEDYRTELAAFLEKWFKPTGGAIGKFEANQRLSGSIPKPSNHYHNE